MVRFRSFHQETSDDDDHEVVLGEWLRPRRIQKYKSLKEIMKIAPRIENLIENDNGDGDGDGDGLGDDYFSHVVFEQCRPGEKPDGDDKYSLLVCEQCRSGEKPEELLLCDKCDRGFHMLCHRPVVVRVPFGPWFCHSCSGRNLPPPPFQSFSQTKLMDFFKIRKCGGSSANHSHAQVGVSAEMPVALQCQIASRHIVTFGCGVMSTDLVNRITYTYKLLFLGK